MTRLVAFFLLIPLMVLADIIPEPPRAQVDLPGSWEAVAEADSTLRAVVMTTFNFMEPFLILATLAPTGGGLSLSR